jgi:hypothetical protein
VQLAVAAKIASQNKVVVEKSVAPAPTTKTKKVVTEIDRLLQDEGVVNLLYDVEQPDSRKRLVPITKSQKKVMDVEKAERELMLRTKLVRNAVLRLRNSSATNLKISPRSRRNATVSFIILMLSISVSSWTMIRYSKDLGMFFKSKYLNINFCLKRVVLESLIFMLCE